MNWHQIVNTLLRNSASIIKITLTGTIFLILLLLLVVPVTYQAKVSILPPEKNSQLSGLGSLLAGSDLNNLLPGGSNSASAQLYGEILKSRSASLYVVKKLKLAGYYNSKNNIDAAEKLSKNLNININKEGILELSVDVQSYFLPIIFSDKEKLKKLSAKISNTFIEALDDINRKKISSKAKNARIYIEQQLIQTKANLDSAETALMQFQKNNKAVALPEQIEAVIKNAGELKSEMLKTEIQLNLLKSNVNENNRTYNSLEKKLESLREQYSKFEVGSKDYMLAFKDIPALGKELASILREVKIQNEIYVLLQQQYFKEKIQESRDLPTIEILDEAITPEKKAAPKTLLSGFAGMICFFVLSSVFFLVQEKKKFH